MAVFLLVWARGAEWYPYNAFRMFATYQTTPIFYERYVTRDAGGARGRNWHYHELNPVLNRKRLMDGLERCVAAPDDADCVAFLDFAARTRRVRCRDLSNARLPRTTRRAQVPRARAMRDAPAALVVQTRSWDFGADLDAAGFCDSMSTLELDVAARAVTRTVDQPCDALDLRACCASTLGTI